jgi:hypothetical protein
VNLTLAGKKLTGHADEGIGQGGFAVINMGDDSHISDVLPLVHGGTHLFHSKVHHFGRKLLKVVEVVVTSWITNKKRSCGTSFFS